MLTHVKKSNKNVNQLFAFNTLKFMYTHKKYHHQITHEIHTRAIINQNCIVPKEFQQHNLQLVSVLKTILYNKLPQRI